ncbi:MAG TPA: Asp-tRNA(Asn)/Glu-tRNA(Gln) amidotransferase subunit GatC [Candidatus Saccharimonadales bacterium]|nr:Asp-tRNA(Asn)/Glu-tRNA(Gln) amidotransferase subunit GatC [Candidatus Saccharimonadales bacterium]
MAKITRNDVLKLATLAKLKFQEGELESFVDRFTEELNAIVKYVEQIDAVDTEGLEPTDQVTGLSNVMRPDEPVDYGASPDELLKNAPAVEKHQIKVKRILN